MMAHKTVRREGWRGMPGLGCNPVQIHSRMEQMRRKGHRLEKERARARKEMVKTQKATLLLKEERGKSKLLCM